MRIFRSDRMRPRRASGLKSIDLRENASRPALVFTIRLVSKSIGSGISMTISVSPGLPPSRAPPRLLQPFVHIIEIGVEHVVGIVGDLAGQSVKPAREGISRWLEEGPLHFPPQNP